MKKALVLVAGLLLAAVALAQQYKWVDKDGKVQYGDTPPAGAKATAIKPPPGPPSSSSSPAPAAKKDAKKLTPEQAFQKRQQDDREKADKTAKEQAEAQTRRTNCEQSRASLRTLQSGQRVSTTNTAGERDFMNEAQLAQEIARTEKAVGEWCK